jgi:two-component system, NtrC family, sensor kinase
MEKSYQTRMLAVALAVATLAVCILAGLNFSREGDFDMPTDGVLWSETANGLVALHVPHDSPAQRAGIRENDVLVAANEHPTPRLAQLERQIFRTGSWGHATYSIVRSVPGSASPARLDAQVILEPTDRSINQGLRLIALVYLLIGLYVLFRRWTAPKATHFYIFCLTSCVLYACKSSGQFDGLDWTFYWGNIVAGALQPALFLHFAVTFGEGISKLRRTVVSTLLYVPGLLIAALQVVAIEIFSATENLRHRLDEIGIGYLALYYVIAAVVFYIRYRRSDQPLERQQLKWLSRGTLLSVVPFTLFYVIPYLSQRALPFGILKVAGLTLVFLPLTFAWAIVRYRLMDTDLIFKRGVTYTLATAALVGVYFAVVGMSGEIAHTKLPSLRLWGLVAVIVATALIFDPIKSAIQGRIDRVFDRKRYDYRETLIEFSRGLSSETDLAALAQSIVERLSQTLLVARVAVFLAPVGEESQGPQLAAAHGLTPNEIARILESAPAAGFLRFDAQHRHEENGHIFLEKPEDARTLVEADRSLAATLDMHYFLPCRVADRRTGRARAIAVIGLGRTQDDDFLSSEDMEFLESLAGYIGIAIQNAQLFSSLESKITEFERLKEFNENIVESIKVGIFTLNLEDRIESWNAEMEVMYALSRGEALGRSISDVFPAGFVEAFERSKTESGTHHLSKVRLQMLTGETRTANIAIAPLLTRDFVSVGRIVLVDDITGRVELEAQLTQAEKLSSIGLLAAGVAHEVNTPLAVISSYTQMLRKQTSDDPRLSMVLDKITQQTFRASEIVNGLLNFSRKTSSEFVQVDLNAVMRETVALLEHQFRTAKITVQADLAVSLPCVDGSQGKLQQVVLNLMLNAKDAMADSATPHLTVATRATDTHVFLSISDKGSGIDPAHLHKIYDPFFTTKNAPREGQHKGTGLGLAVSYGIVQEHGGKIRVDSAVGEGTTFHLEFPISGLQQTVDASSRGYAGEQQTEKIAHA